MIIKNLGPVKNANIELKQETIFWGSNNSGKTYISYALYGIFDFIKKLDIDWVEIEGEDIDFDFIYNSRNIKISLNSITQKFSEIIEKEVNKNLKEILSKTFNRPEEEFVDTTITFEENELFIYLSSANYCNITSKISDSYSYSTSGLKVDFDIKKENDEILIELRKLKNELNRLPEDNLLLEVQNNKNLTSQIKNIMNQTITSWIYQTNKILYIPAERNGINVFRDELLIQRSDYFDKSRGEVGKDKGKNLALYPSPISDYINFLNSVQVFYRNRDFFRNIYLEDNSIWFYFLENIIQGKYEYDEKNKQIFYRELHAKTKDGEYRYKTKKVPLNVSSSSTKTLFGIELYLELLANEGDILLIDEPEMNLDPQKQIEFGKILSMLAEKGIKVIVSTHSDYLIRSTTNTLLKNEYSSIKMTLQDKDVACYSFTPNKVDKVDSLIRERFISNFDQPNQNLEDEYYDLLDKIENENIE